MYIELFAYAPDFIKKVAARYGFSDSKAYAMFRVYEDVDPVKHPALRDRRPELMPAVAGMAGAPVTLNLILSGRDLHDNYGFEAVGAQFVQKFCILMA